MRKITVALLILLAWGCNNSKTDLKDLIRQRIAESDINLIPDSAGTTPSYCCTWSCQNFATDTFSIRYAIGLGDHTVPSDNLTEEAVFHNPGWEKRLPQGIKKDLFLVFDVGWDIAGGSHAEKEKKWILGTHEVATDKFPSCTGTPEEKLSKINGLSKKAGWKGAGLWIAAQSALDSRGLKPTEKELEAFFRERLRWSKNTGIYYWKVDYGARGGDINFRQMLTRLAHEEAPELWVEHGRGSGPFNDDECPWDSPNIGKTGSYKYWDSGKALATAHNLLGFSDVLRTYDVSAQLSVPTTIDRVAQILNSFTSKPTGKGIINCEDEPYIAAALGCAIGVMRNPAFIIPPDQNYDPLRSKDQMDAVIRAVRWQRMSAAFSVGFNTVTLDSTFNKDYWKFQTGQSWAKWMTGKTVMQEAPTRVARGLEMPEVKCEGQKPYVLCSKFPNGNYAIATMLRTDSLKGFFYPTADITIRCDKPKPLGVFGRFKSLTVCFPDEVKIQKVFAQDLAGNKGFEITDLVKKEGSSILFSGELLNLIGLSSASKNDVSEPGLILVFK